MTDWHERFHKHYEKASPARCWNWRSSRNNHGYGRFMLRGKSRIASRLAYEIANGSIPAGNHVLHDCDNPACVNPHHLHLGDHLQNMAERNARGRARGGSMPGELHPRAKLRNAETDEIRRMARNADITQNEIAQQFGVSQSRISRIKNTNV